MSNKKISQTAANCHFTTIVLFRMVLSSVLCVWIQNDWKLLFGKLNTSFQDGSVNPSVKFIQRHSTYSLDTSSFFLLFYFAHSATHKNFFCLLFSSVYIIICMCMEAGVGKKVINFSSRGKNRSSLARLLACQPYTNTHRSACTLRSEKHTKKWNAMKNRHNRTQLSEAYDDTKKDVHRIECVRFSVENRFWIVPGSLSNIHSCNTKSPRQW